MERAIVLTGVVVHGDARGRELGFPTANVAVPASVDLPPDGIYAGWLQRAYGQALASAISVGRRPTFYDTAGKSLVEVHVLNWSGDLYDEEVTVKFVARLRDEMRFRDIASLVTQMGADCRTACELLTKRAC